MPDLGSAHEELSLHQRPTKAIVGLGQEPDFTTEKEFLLGMIPPPRDKKQSLETFLVVTVWGGVTTGIWWVEPRDAT